MNAFRDTGMTQRLAARAIWGLCLAAGTVWVAAAAEQPRSDQDRLQGVWRGWVVHGKGEKPDEGHLQLELTVKGDQMTAKQIGRGPQPDPDLGEGTFRLTFDTKPRQIDAVRTNNPGKGQRYAGIYDLDGDTFRWCSGSPGRPRPEDFVTRQGQFLLILKRQKP